jgi:hypothetical protein
MRRIHAQRPHEPNRQTRHQTHQHAPPVRKENIDFEYFELFEYLNLLSHLNALRHAVRKRRQFEQNEEIAP